MLKVFQCIKHPCKLIVLGQAAEETPEEQFMYLYLWTHSV